MKSKEARVFTSVTTGFGEVASVSADAYGADMRTVALTTIAVASPNRFCRGVAAVVDVEISMWFIALFFEGCTGGRA